MPPDNPSCVKNIYMPIIISGAGEASRGIAVICHIRIVDVH